MSICLSILDAKAAHPSGEKQAMKRDSSSEDVVIQAAGGLLWRDSQAGKEIALIRRPRYGDWTLPKGKLKQGESWQQAALREVREETECDARLCAFLGCTCYSVRRVPKVVLFWQTKFIRSGIIYRLTPMN